MALRVDGPGSPDRVVLRGLYGPPYLGRPTLSALHNPPQLARLAGGSLEGLSEELGLAHVERAPPSILLDKHDPRRSHICHAKPEEPPAAHWWAIMNSWAFCDWFIARTPAELLFEQAYAKRAQAIDGTREFADADTKPVPAHSTLEGGKSTAVVALQLLKRNRNIRYMTRKGRMPPSVMMAKFTANILYVFAMWK